MNNIDYVKFLNSYEHPEGISGILCLQQHVDTNKYLGVEFVNGCLEKIKSVIEYTQGEITRVGENKAKLNWLDYKLVVLDQLETSLFNKKLELSL